MKRFICALFVVYIFSYLSAVIVIQAYIYDNVTRKPLQGAIITDGKTHSISDEKGFFYLKTYAEILTISRIGYQRLQIKTTAIGDTILMQRVEIKLPVIRVVGINQLDLPSAANLTRIELNPEILPQSIGNLLQSYSSISSNDTPLPAEPQAISLLGNLSRHTLVILDGVPLNANGEAFDLSTIQLERLESIDIVKGSSSVYGGASAIGGIIYLKSRTADSTHSVDANLDNCTGSFGLFRSNIAWQQRFSRLGYRLNLTHASAENDFPYKPRSWWNVSGNLKRDNNAKKLQSLSWLMYGGVNNLNGKYLFDWEITKRQLPGPVNFLAIYEKAHLDAEAQRHSLSLDYDSRVLNSSLIIWDNQEYSTYDNTKAPNPVYSTKYEQYHRSSGIKYLLANQSLLKPVKFVLTNEFNRQQYDFHHLTDSHLSIDLKKKDNLAFGLRAEAEYLFSDTELSTTLASRYDKTESFGGFTSLRLEQTVAWDFGLKIGCNMGKGFSLPSFYDLYWKGDAQSLGNPELKPETAVSYNLWSSYSNRNNQLKLGFYYSEIDNLIQWQQVYLYGTAWKPFNIGKAEIVNYEGELNLKPKSWLSYRGSLTFTSAHDYSTYPNGFATATYGKFLTYTPAVRWQQNLTLSYKAMELHIQQNHTGKQYSTPDNLIKPLKPWTTYDVDLIGKWSQKPLDLIIYLQVNNVFDKQYEIYDYVPQPGFNWTAGLKLSYQKR